MSASFNMSAPNDAIESGEITVKPTTKPTKKHDPLDAKAAKLRTEIQILQKEKALQKLDPHAPSATKLRAEIRLLQKQLALQKLDPLDKAGVQKLRAEILLLKKQLALQGSQHQRDSLKNAHALQSNPLKGKLAHNATALKSKPLPRSNHTAAKNATRAKSPFAKLFEKSNGKTVKAELSGTTEHGAVAAPLAVASVVAVCACVAVFAVIRRRQRDSAATAPAAEGYNTLV